MLSLWKKRYDQPRQHFKKQRHYFADECSSSQSYGFSNSHVWMWELKESWALKNWCFWTVVLEKTLESPLDARRSNQSIPKEISPGISLEGMMLKLELQYFGHLMQRNDWLEKTLILGKIEGRRRRGRQRTRWLDSIIDSNGVEQTQRCGEGQGSLVCCSPWVSKSWTQLSDWITTGSSSDQSWACELRHKRWWLKKKAHEEMEAKGNRTIYWGNPYPLPLAGVKLRKDLRF